MEHSDRGRYVTNQVTLWICNDSNYIKAARKAIKHDALPDLLSSILLTSQPYSAPWQVAQELAPNDYNRIDWSSVAEDLTTE